MSQALITGIVSINKHEVCLNGHTLPFDKEVFKDFHVLIRELYKYSGASYPKFYKMDNLSKLAWIGAELLLLNKNHTYLPDQMHLVFSNRSSSLDTDMAHQKAIDDGLASPALFVYTLPNISCGEVAIRHKMMGATLFFVSEKPNAQQIYQCTKVMGVSEPKSLCLCGWVEYYKGTYELVLICVEQNIDILVSPVENLSIFAKESTKHKALFTEKTIYNIFNKSTWKI